MDSSVRESVPQHRNRTLDSQESSTGTGTGDGEEVAFMSASHMIRELLEKMSPITLSNSFKVLRQDRGKTRQHNEGIVPRQI